MEVQSRAGFGWPAEGDGVPCVGTCQVWWYCQGRRPNPALSHWFPNPMRIQFAPLHWDYCCWVLAAVGYNASPKEVELEPSAKGVGLARSSCTFKVQKNLTLECVRQIESRRGLLDGLTAEIEPGTVRWSWCEHLRPARDCRPKMQGEQGRGKGSSEGRRWLQRESGIS